MHILETDSQVQEDGKLHVTVGKSNASRSDIYSGKSMGFSCNTPRPSNMSNAEIYSLQSSRNPTPRGSSFNNTDFYPVMGTGGRNSSFCASDVYGFSSSQGLPLRPSSFEEETGIMHTEQDFTREAIVMRIFHPWIPKKIRQRSQLDKKFKKIYTCLFGVQVILQFRNCLEDVIMDQ
ncbi:hypothetical protein F511_22295 [Dorcoceras hygrometricum]|uniref:Uncharacterized protein n=1 Tax=Dorcoceras hygrometricum TaxID=472368 RepID=A0A2Z7DB58_9LAMI|nr:hypothetical protein F511_22295 [Dorcoceras hygrometricum]